MKKLLALSVLALAIDTIQAANIQWTLNTGAATMRAADGSTVLNGGTAYLILANDLSSIQGDIVGGNGFSTIIGNYALDSAGITGGKINPTTRTADTNKIVAGTAYDFQVLVYDATADKYYATSTKNQKAYDPLSSDDALQIPKAITLGATDLYAVRGTATANAPYQEGTSVPEPATGALALAGVALLFRRRRA